MRFFGRSKHEPLIFDTSGPWSVAQGAYDGKPMVVRLNVGLRAIAGHERYPLQEAIPGVGRDAEEPQDTVDGPTRRFLVRLSPALRLSKHAARSTFTAWFTGAAICDPHQSGARPYMSL